MNDDEALRAELALAHDQIKRLRAFIAIELEDICLNGEGAWEAFERRDRYRAILKRTDDDKPCKGRNSNVCVAEGCYGEACIKGDA